MYGIIRIDRDASNTYTWLVTIQPRHRLYTRRFGDQRHGGKRKALKAAIDYRDVLIAMRAPLNRRERCAIRKKKNNRSGVSGVSRIEITDRRWKNPVRTGYWLAKWPLDGGRFKQCKLSIQKYGERGAYLRAVRTRTTALSGLA